MEKQVFISYKAEEFDEASWVRQVLESHNISCWMAPSCIPGGSSYASEIPKAIKNCKVFVLILSSRSQASKWVSKEVDLAINYGKTVMPFMLENCDLKDDFNFYLTNVQRYAAYENKLQAAEKMLKEIQAVIGAQAHFDPSSVPPVTRPTGGMGNGGMGNGGMGNGGMGNGGNVVRPTNAGALLLTPPTGGDPIFLTREAVRSKFGVSGVVGLILAILALVWFGLCWVATSAEVNVGYVEKNYMVAVLTVMTFIPSFIAFVVCCRGVRGGKRVSLVSRIIGGIGLGISIIALVLPIFMGLSALGGEKAVNNNHGVSYDFNVSVFEREFNVKVDGLDGEIITRYDVMTDSEQVCCLNVGMSGSATVTSSLITVNCSANPDSYTLYFDYTTDPEIVSYLESMKSVLLATANVSEGSDDVDKVNTLLAFGPVTVNEGSVLYN